MKVEATENRECCWRTRGDVKAREGREIKGVSQSQAKCCKKSEKMKKPGREMEERKKLSRPWLRIVTKKGK